ncbi:hypothetical protein BJV77DRAFT_1025786 [Russula vinacea]|nr:hypothetical protein BJV77DRAFT_1025786 [Russula vinacea]
MHAPTNHRHHHPVLEVRLLLPRHPKRASEPAPYPCLLHPPAATALGRQSPMRAEIHRRLHRPGSHTASKR